MINTSKYLIPGLAEAFGNTSCACEQIDHGQSRQVGNEFLPRSMNSRSARHAMDSNFLS
jgi:hypothetical protein